NLIFFFQAEDGIRAFHVTGVQTCALPICIEGMPSAHFSAENGPTCATCHMPEVPVEHATRISHALWPILPAHASGVAGIEDSCTACHGERDRKSTRLNSSHVKISYAVFCLKKKKRPN